MAPFEETLNVELEFANPNIRETNFELKSQRLDREANSASAVQQSKIEPSTKHGPTPMSLEKGQNTVKTTTVSVETQTESQLPDVDISPAECQSCEKASKTAKPPAETFAVVHSLNDKTIRHPETKKTTRNQPRLTPQRLSKSQHSS